MFRLDISSCFSFDYSSTYMLKADFVPEKTDGGELFSIILR